MSRITTATLLFGLSVMVSSCAQQPTPSASPQPVYTPRVVEASVVPPPPPAPPPPPPVNYNAKSLALKLRMSEQEVIQLLGKPVKSEARTCGQQTGRAFNCKMWSYGSYPAPLGGGQTMSVWFQEDPDGEWRVNSWN